MFGPACDLTKLNGVALEQTGADSVVVAVARSKDCHSGLLTVKADDGVVSIPEAPAAKAD